MTHSNGCPVCRSTMQWFASGTVLGRIDVDYFRCTGCGLVTLPEPTWLDQAYSNAITSMDVGLLSRCQSLAGFTAAMVRSERLGSGPFLDWAGGYGTLTRMMRDRGFDFFHLDPLCENVFAQGFEGDLVRQYQLITAYEVLEHLADPVTNLSEVAASTDRLLMTSYLLPEPAPAPSDWWYYTPETGQHITFYTERALATLAQRLGYSVITDGVSRHLFYRGSVSSRTRLLLSPLSVKAHALNARARATARRWLGRMQPLTSSDSALRGQAAGLAREE